MQQNKPKDPVKQTSYIHTACNGHNTNEIHALLGVAMAKSVDL